MVFFPDSEPVMTSSKVKDNGKYIWEFKCFGNEMEEITDIWYYHVFFEGK